MEIIPTTRIENMSLNRKEMNVLKQAGICTAADLYSFTDFELSQLPGMDSQTLFELQMHIHHIRYYCSGSADDLPTGEEHYVPRLRLEDLWIDGRTINALRRKGITSVAELLTYSKKDLLSLHFSEDTVRRISEPASNRDYYLSSVDRLPHPENEPRPVTYPKIKFNADSVLRHYSEKLVPGVEPSRNRFYTIIEKKFETENYGANPGAIVIFDRTLPFKKGTLSCFQTADGRVCFDGKLKEKDLTHLGRAIAILNYYPEYS